MIPKRIATAKINLVFRRLHPDVDGAILSHRSFLSVLPRFELHLGARRCFIALLPAVRHNFVLCSHAG